MDWKKNTYKPVPTIIKKSKIHAFFNDHGERLVEELKALKAIERAARICHKAGMPSKDERDALALALQSYDALQTLSPHEVSF